MPAESETSDNRLVRWLRGKIGGSANLSAVGLLAGMLALNSADMGAVGAVAPQLQQSLHLSASKIGLLVTITSIIGAVATIPIGNLTDRVSRVKLMWISILAWGVAEGSSGLVNSFGALIAVRVALAGVTATAGPTVASLTGDLFPVSSRARIYSFIVTGELIGTGIGIVVSGLTSAWFGWRVGIAVLAAPSFALAWAVHRHLPEPKRGAHTEMTLTQRPEAEQSKLAQAVSEVKPKGKVLDTSKHQQWNLWHAIRYVLSVKTNVAMIVSSCLGYFFFAGIRTFGLLFLEGHFDVSQSVSVGILVVAGAGSVVGLISNGRLADKLLSAGRADARVLVGGLSYLLATAVLAPLFVIHSLPIGVPLLVLGGAALAAPEGVLDAARLDVVPFFLWGRAEGVQTMLRGSLEAFAPLVFGSIADAWKGGTHTQAFGLRMTFLVMLVPLTSSGLILLRARRAYPVDVASAMESEKRYNAE